jgi:hypothetical protein
LRGRRATPERWAAIAPTAQQCSTPECARSSNRQCRATLAECNHPDQSFKLRFLMGAQYKSARWPRPSIGGNPGIC